MNRHSESTIVPPMMRLTAIKDDIAIIKLSSPDMCPENGIRTLSSGNIA